MQIDLLSVITNKDGSYLASYFRGEDEGIIEIQIQEDSLIEYIIDHELNVQAFTNWSAVSLECDGLDEIITDPFDYLKVHLDEVVLDYLTQYS